MHKVFFNFFFFTLIFVQVCNNFLFFELAFRIILKYANLEPKVTNYGTNWNEIKDLANNSIFSQKVLLFEQYNLCSCFIFFSESVILSTEKVDNLQTVYQSFCSLWFLLNFLLTHLFSNYLALFSRLLIVSCISKY